MSEKTRTFRLKDSIFIGVVCIFSYLVSYYSRHLASVTSPSMLEEGIFTESFYSLLTSVYMVTYASGQLFNGIIGDLFNPKRLITYGLCGTAVTSIAFAFLPFNWMRLICYALLGFSLSMLRGPLVKIIAENTSQNHSRVIGTFLSVATFAGPFIASNIFLLCGWKWTYVAAGGLTCAICITAITIITRFERKGIITYRLGKKEGIKGVLSVFKIERFFFYMVVGAVLETALTAVAFWVPNYLANRLGFGVEVAASMFSVICVFKGLMPFVTLFLFRVSKENDILLLRIFFALSVVFYLGTAFITSTWVNVVLLSLAMMSSSCASALLWSIYIPGMGKTGRVSSINGILDCSGYIVAGICNVFFGIVAQYLNWTGVVLLWAGIVFVGLVAALLQKAKKAE